MSTKEKPVICVSRCLSFDNCRYNGDCIEDETIKRLQRFVNFITICPECDIGLPTPREALRVVKKNDTVSIIQPKTEEDYTVEMLTYSNKFLSQLKDIDAFILKSRSPSCGIKDVKIYSSTEKSASFEKGNGLFAEEVYKRFAEFPIEDEGRLTNYKIRENFFTRIFTLFDFRRIKNEKTMESLNQFHCKNKLLLQSYNIKETSEMGKVLANHNHNTVEDVFAEYEKHLRKALSKSQRYTSNINVLQHAFGYFSKYITEQEKQFVLDSVEKYRKGHLPLSTPIYIIKSYIIRFDIEYLKNQTFFDPYPEELIEMRDSGKGV